MSSDADVSKLVDRLGSRWATVETSFKWHASCRHTHPAADALQALMSREGLRANDIAHVTARVHQGAIDVLGAVTNPTSVHQAKFSMGTVLGLVAVHRAAGLDEFEQHAMRNEQVLAFRDRVSMTLDDEVDSEYPRRWIGKVEVETNDGRVLSARVDVPKGDPGNTLTREELTAKALKLAGFGAAATSDETRAAIERVWRLEDETRIGPLVRRGN